MNKGQEFLYNALTADENGLEWLEYVSRTDLINIPDDKKYCALIVEQPFDFSQVVPNRPATKLIEDFNISVLIPAKNTNDLSEENFKDIRGELYDKSAQVVAVIANAVRTANGISNVVFGRGNADFITVSSRPYDLMIIPVKITLIN